MKRKKGESIVFQAAGSIVMERGRSASHQAVFQNGINSMFVGREKELAMLKSEWEQPGFRMPIIYGRRRVGKTAILEKFSEKRNILFFTPGMDAKRNVADLRNVMISRGIDPRSKDMRGLLQEIFDVSTEKRIGLIIDEFP